MRKLKVDFNAVVDAMDKFDFDSSQYYLDLETGKIVVVHSEMEAELLGLDEDEMEHISEEDKAQERAVEEDESGRYVEIPTSDSHDNFRVMEDFVRTVKNARTRELLEFAIGGPKPFRRFKDALLKFPDERQRWFDFEAAARREEVRRWLENLEIEAEDISKRPGSPRQ